MGERPERPETARATSRATSGGAGDDGEQCDQEHENAVAEDVANVAVGTVLLGDAEHDQW